MMSLSTKGNDWISALDNDWAEVAPDRTVNLPGVTVIGSSFRGESEAWSMSQNIHIKTISRTMLTLVKIWLKIKHAAYCKDEQHTTLSLFAFGFFGGCKRVKSSLSVLWVYPISILC